MQHDFVYVSKNERKPVKKELIELINLVQDDIRDKFTFKFTFVGSDQRNMVTMDRKGNTGYDFDVNIEPNDDDEQYSPKQIKHILMNSFNKFVGRYGYKCCEDSTRVFTIKKVSTKKSKIIHSCDFCIVNNYGDGQQEYIRFNKAQGSYTWEEQSSGYYQLEEKVEFCKENNLWNDVKNLYFEKKNSNDDKNKKSRTIFAETIHEICQKNGFYD